MVPAIKRKRSATADYDIKAHIMRRAANRVRERILRRTTDAICSQYQHAIGENHPAKGVDPGMSPRRPLAFHHSGHPEKARKAFIGMDITLPVYQQTPKGNRYSKVDPLAFWYTDDQPFCQTGQSF